MFVARGLISAKRWPTHLPSVSIRQIGQTPVIRTINHRMILKNMTVRHARNVVTLVEAKAMPRRYEELSNDVLIVMAVLGDQEAREERLIRDIMAIDDCSWKDAQSTFLKIVESNRRGLFISTLPYKIGIFTAVSAAFVSIPMIFDINTVMYFNELYVTSDVPEEKDLETPLEVGSWAWNWMEPPLGQISFFLLCMQYARSQLENLGAKPYTGWFKNRRAQRLVKEFPKYNADILIAFSEGDPLTGAPVNL